jgi:hypothetical protein
MLQRPDIVHTNAAYRVEKQLQSRPLQMPPSQNVYSRCEVHPRSRPTPEIPSFSLAQFPYSGYFGHASALSGVCVG